LNLHALKVLEYAEVKRLLEGFASSGLGKRRVREVEPLIDVEEVERLIAETTELKELLAPARELPIGGLHDVFPLFDGLDGGVEVLNSEEILLIADTLRAGRTIKGYLEDADERLPRMRGYADAIHLQRELEERIAATFNEGGAIKNTASSRLKSVRKNIEQLRGRIRSKLQSLLRAANVGPYLQDTGIREVKGRPTLAIKAQHAGKVAGARRDRSDSGGTIFVEPEGVRGMSEELEGALDEEKAEMKRILQEITGMIASRSKEMRETLGVLAHIDMTYAKVRLSRTFGMNPPVFNGEGIVRLQEARHPLLMEVQQQTGEPEEVVPIDVRLGEDFDTLIVTGPNTGGKTVTLKTIGLLALMGQSGMHVSAAAAELPIFMNVLADIGDEQSIEQSLSTFSSHLRNVAEILEQADSRSLVLMDELGGGTDPAEGAALARAILEFLHERKVRTAVSTHISDLKKLGYTVPGIENASIEFDLATLRPTHRLMIGTPGSSNALAIARRLGLSEEVIDRAEQSPKGDDPTAELINQLQAAKAAAVENQKETGRAREEVERLEREWRKKMDEVADKEVEVKAQKGEEAFDVLRSLRKEMGKLLKREPTRRGLLQALGEMAGGLDEKLDNTPQAEQQKQLQVGDEVVVRSLDRVGVLGEIDVPGKKAVVRFGEIPMRVALDELAPFTP
jgi:DNA mismatch repair protein MutS2